MRYAYQRNGRPLLSWRGGTAPQGTRAADTKALGSLGGTSLDGSSILGPTLELPRAGAPEPLGDCTCKGTTSGLIGQPMGDAYSLAIPWGAHHPMPGQYVHAVAGFADRVSALPLPVKVAAAGALYLLYRQMKKRR